MEIHFKIILILIIMTFLIIDYNLAQCGMKQTKIDNDDSKAWLGSSFACVPVAFFIHHVLPATLSYKNKSIIEVHGHTEMSDRSKLMRWTCCSVSN